jgi:hypothetical protein
MRGFFFGAPSASTQSLAYPQPPRRTETPGPDRATRLREGSFWDRCHERGGANVRVSGDDLTIALLATDSRLIAGTGFSVSP